MHPVPIRVHAGAPKRGRKLSDYKRALLTAAVHEVRQRRRVAGSIVSIREIAQRHGVPKSTLHRYLRLNSSPSPTSSVPISAVSEVTKNKCAINFIINLKEDTPAADIKFCCPLSLLNLN